MTRNFAHQDASGAAGAPLAIFVNGDFAEYVDKKNDPYGEKAIARIAAAQPSGSRSSVESLTECINHPRVPAVDCTDCDPLED